jgi:hypothetical protein
MCARLRSRSLPREQRRALHYEGQGGVLSVVVKIGCARSHGGRGSAAYGACGGDSAASGAISREDLDAAEKRALALARGDTMSNTWSFPFDTSG